MPPARTGLVPALDPHSAWTVLRHLGRAGYQETTREAMDATVAQRTY